MRGTTRPNATGIGGEPNSTTVGQGPIHFMIDFVLTVSGISAVQSIIEGQTERNHDVSIGPEEKNWRS